jgi:hypothetical protein
VKNADEREFENEHMFVSPGVCKSRSSSARSSPGIWLLSLSVPQYIADKSLKKE